MSFGRLIAITSVFAGCCAVVSAQVGSNEKSIAAMPQPNPSLNLFGSPETDRLFLNLYPHKEFRMHENPGIDVPNSDTSDGADGFHGASVAQLAAPDAGCYAIRSYKVVRDRRGSDSTHRVDYTTCVPAARFKMFSTVYRESAKAPKLSR